MVYKFRLQNISFVSTLQKELKIILSSVDREINKTDIGPWHHESYIPVD